MTSRRPATPSFPRGPCAMPSETAMVTNSRGVPPAAFTPSLRRLGLAVEREVARRRLVPRAGDADPRLVDVLIGQPHGRKNARCGARLGLR